MHPDWYFVSYEDFIRNAPDIIADWAAAFDLPAIDAMRRVAQRPSLSTKEATLGPWVGCRAVFSAECRQRSGAIDSSLHQA